MGRKLKMYFKRAVSVFLTLVMLMSASVIPGIVSKADNKTFKIFFWSTGSILNHHTHIKDMIDMYKTTEVQGFLGGSCEVTDMSLAQNNTEQHLPSNIDLTMYDMVVIAFPAYDLNDDDLLALRNYLNAGGRVFLQLENTGMCSVENEVASRAAAALGGDFSVDPGTNRPTEDKNIGKEVAVINVNTNMLRSTGGALAGAGSIEFNCAANIIYTGKAEGIAFGSAAKHTSFCGLVDQALLKGRLTISTDVNFWLTATGGYLTAAKDLLARFVLNSVDNMAIVEAGGNPNDLLNHVHNFTTSYAYNSTHHWRECTADGATETCSFDQSANRGAHSGGTASCIAKAKCSVCGQGYGNLAGHHLVYSASGASLAATCDTTGCTTAYYLTLSVPSVNYSGAAVTVGIGTDVQRGAWENAGLTLPTVVKHYSGVTELNAAPTVAGDYIAKVTHENQTAYINYSIIDLHTHTIEKVDQVAASCLNDGCKEYYYCSGDGCGEYYEDAAGNTVIADINDWKQDASKGLIPATGHSYSSSWASNSEKHWHPATCEHSDLVKDEAAHSWNGGQVTTPPAVGVDGVRTFTCTVCGEQRTESIPKLHAHNPVKIDGYPASCLNDGCMDYYECTDDEDACGKFFEDLECENEISDIDSWLEADGLIESLGHHRIRVEGHAASCLSDGWKSYYHCDRCDTYYEDAGCTSEIGDSSDLENWKAIFGEGLIPATGHTFEEGWSTDANKHWRRAICEHQEIKKNLAAHTWSEGVVVSSPTTAEEGEIKYTCTVCQKTKTESIPKIELEDIFEINENLSFNAKDGRVEITWGKVEQADGYIVYGAYCGDKFKALKTVSGKKPQKAVVTKLNGRKLDDTKIFKFYVLSYRVINGKKIYGAETVKAHVAGPKSKVYTNAKNLRLDMSEMTVKIGGQRAIKAKVVLMDKTKKQLPNNHCREIRYAIVNPRIAAVSVNGVIKAKRPGKTTIYVFARNGMAKKIKLTVVK